MAHEAHVSPDEAREALANVEAVETKVASLNARLNAVGSLASGGWSGVIIAAPQSALFTAMEFPSGWWVLVPWFCFLGLGLFFLVRLQRELNPLPVKIQMGFWVHTIMGCDRSGDSCFRPWFFRVADGNCRHNSRFLLFAREHVPSVPL